MFGPNKRFYWVAMEDDITFYCLGPFSWLDKCLFSLGLGQLLKRRNYCNIYTNELITSINHILAMGPCRGVDRFCDSVHSKTKLAKLRLLVKTYYGGERAAILPVSLLCLTSQLLYILYITNTLPLVH